MQNLLEAPCGIHCGMCVLNQAGSDEELRTLVSEKLHLPKDKVVCSGCRAINGFCPVNHEQCATWLCAKEKGVAFCSECTEFPCRKLMPCADRASELPQNIKVFSLTLRKTKGDEEWRRSIEEVYGLYFKGALVLGHGPVLKE